MSLLQVFLPQHWPTADGNSMPLRWRLTEGITSRIGESPIDQLPRGADVELIVPASRVLFTRVKLPPGNTSRLSEMASYAAEDRLLGDPDTIHAAVGNRSADGHATAAIVDKAWLASIRDRFTAAERRPVRAVSEIAAAPLTLDAWNVVWHGDHGWLRTAEDQGLVVDANGEDVPFALRLAVQEARALGGAPERLIIHVAESQSLPDLARWEKDLGLPVETGSPWSWQKVDAPIVHGINLLQGPFAPSRSGSEMLARYRIPATLAAGIAALYIIVSVTDWAVLAWQKRSLQTQMISTFKTAFPDATNIVNAPLQMQRKLMDLKRAHGEAQSSDFIPLLSNALPAINATGGTAQGVQYERGKLQLDVRLPQAQPPEILNQQLSGNGLQAKVETVNPTPNGAIARITFAGGNP